MKCSGTTRLEYTLLVGKERDCRSYLGEELILGNSLINLQIREKKSNQYYPLTNVIKIVKMWTQKKKIMKTINGLLFNGLRLAIY